jgi:hypothetical protein
MIINKFRLVILFLVIMFTTTTYSKNMQTCVKSESSQMEIVEIGEKCPNGFVNGFTTDRIANDRNEENNKIIYESFKEKAVGGAILGGAVALLVYVFIFLKRFYFKNKIRIAENREEIDKIYSLALDEVRSGQVDKLIWARALVESDGDESRASSIYMKIRAKQINKF